jgi:hypothetical protein
MRMLALTPNGDLYVGGEFENELPVQARNLVRWNGHAWHALGPVLAMIYASGNRLLGGSFIAFANSGAAARKEEVSG